MDSVLWGLSGEKYWYRHCMWNLVTHCTFNILWRLGDFLLEYVTDIYLDRNGQIVANTGIFKTCIMLLKEPFICFCLIPLPTVWDERGMMDHDLSTWYAFPLGIFLEYGKESMRCHYVVHFFLNPCNAVKSKHCSLILECIIQHVSVRTLCPDCIMDGWG